MLNSLKSLLSVLRATDASLSSILDLSEREVSAIAEWDYEVAKSIVEEKSDLIRKESLFEKNRIDLTKEISAKFGYSNLRLSKIASLVCEKFSDSEYQELGALLGDLVREIALKLTNLNNLNYRLRVLYNSNLNFIESVFSSIRGDIKDAVYENDVIDTHSVKHHQSASYISLEG